jgi:non-homologous end joining protein Ku
VHPGIKPACARRTSPASGESSKVIELEKFAPRSDIDPVYFDTPFYLYPDGPIAVEAVQVIGAAMAEAGVVGIGSDHRRDRRSIQSVW